MPLIEGQGVGLAAGLALLVFYSLIYWIVQTRKKTAFTVEGKPAYNLEQLRPKTSIEAAEELVSLNSQKIKKKNKKE
ncbi:hypothetical protein [Bacillus benzoevorans]|uniref:Uncharacterized protein n=1 Tax=Bacillus benzoevorans TaxID=1456 RepID=A0A7X0LYP2_9BACI|nr:hypothetical protein [Bacillus benzoevorans]MBB6447732.1 hypothetical protein [Bacillus benzoevorans]